MGERAGVCVLGSINLDIVCTVAELPAPGETVQALDLQRLPGGKGANQAVASACWGAATSLVGAVGLDEAADMLLAGLLDADVDISRVRRVADTPTGQAQICVSTAGENTIVVIGGANLAVAPTDIDPEVLEGCRVLLTQLETPLPAIEALFSASALGGAMRILNAAPAMAAGRNLFPLADVIVVNLRPSWRATPAEAMRRPLLRTSRARPGCSSRAQIRPWSSPSARAAPPPWAQMMHSLSRAARRASSIRPAQVIASAVS